MSSALSPDSAGLVTWAEQVIDRGEFSPARIRQLRWVAGEFEMARAHPEFSYPDAATARELLAPEAVSAYLDLAERGELRRRARLGDPRATSASMRIRADCIAILGAGAGVRVQIADRPGMPELRETVDGPSRSQLQEFLARRAWGPDAPPGRVRLFAIIGVVLDTGARVGELSALRMSDLDDALTTIRIVRKPQARSVSPAVEEVITLSTGARNALRVWLEVRAQLVAQLQGSATALWVSVRPNHAGTLNAEGHAITRPPGMPLMPRGMQRAYTRAVQEANGALLGSPGWRPLPYRFEQLRRAVTVVAEQ